MLNIVLFEPEIPANTGNIGRTCVATNTRLHLIEPLGFRLNEKNLKRAGMDYWEHLDVTTYIDYRDFLEKTGLQPEEVMYAGDDIPDYEVMTMVGLPVAPADAAPEIKRIAKYISHKNGGAGVARDVIEQVMRAQGHWMGDEAFGW